VFIIIITGSQLMFLKGVLRPKNEAQLSQRSRAMPRVVE